MRPRDWVFACILCAVSIAVLTIIGFAQANQYQHVVNRLDRNTSAIVCILQVVPTERTPANVHDCLVKNGVSP